ncbi:hypothetical protein Efla_002936 [Eimeria flavescens]
MDQRAGQPPGRVEALRQWRAPAVDLFPSGAYGEIGAEGARFHRPPTPVTAAPNPYGYRPGPPQEYVRAHSNPQRDYPPSNARSWERYAATQRNSPPARPFEQANSGPPNSVNESSQSRREWLEVTAYQPVDVVTRTVEVPVTRTVDVFVPKPVVREKIVEVPRIVPRYVEKIVEVPQIEWVERVVEVPEVVYNTKIVPKVEVRENIVEKPVFHQKWVEKIVEVSVVEEVIRYRTIHEPEEIIKYIPRGHLEEEWRGAPILTVPPHQTPELPPKWGGTPQPSPRHPLVQAATHRSA